MVDPVGPSGSVPNISQTSRVTQRQSENSEDVRAATGDSVSISEEAISLAEAEQLASQIGAQLTQDTETLLSSDIERLNSLV